MIPKSPLAQASENTQKELNKLLNSKENLKDKSTVAKVVPDDKIYFKVKHGPLKLTSSKSFLTPAMAAMILSELKGETEGCLTQGSLDTHMWNGIRSRIRGAGLAIDIVQPEAVEHKTKAKRMSMGQNKSN